MVSDKLGPGSSTITNEFFTGIQQAPAVGRAMAEMIIDGGFTTVDLTRLGFDRIIVNQPMYENNIV